MKMTVYFDGVFWSALVEFSDRKQRYKAFSYVFGKEPKDEDILNFIEHSLGKWLSRYEEIDTSSSFSAPAVSQKKKNPKRLQRELNKAKKKPVISSKAQVAMKEAQEQFKQRKKKLLKQERDVKKAERYQLKRAKTHQKKKGH